MENEELWVKYKGDFYNIYNFLTKHHPGGKNYIRPYKNKDVTSTMERTQHSKTAYKILQQYRVIEGDSGSKKQEDLETLIDWNKPMVGQIHHLGEKYKEWVHLPVNKKMRIFGNPILERFTITPWYMVLIWIPINIGLFVHGTRRYIELTQATAPLLPILLLILSGILSWTLLEYSVHRWVFHREPSGKSMIMIYVHFFLHGIHHKIPFDSQRIIFPFLPASLIAFGLFQLGAIFTPESIRFLVCVGFITGYVMYDLFHCYLHHCSPKEDTYAYNMKRYHNQHHFARSDRGFGISTDFWDKIYGTAIALKKLPIAIKW